MKVVKLRLLTIILYLTPILLTVFFTKRTTYFLLCAGIMTILLGLSMKLLPNYIDYKKEVDKYNAPLFTIISGGLLILISVM